MVFLLAVRCTIAAPIMLANLAWIRDREFNRISSCGSSGIQHRSRSANHVTASLESFPNSNLRRGTKRLVLTQRPVEVITL